MRKLSLSLLSSILLLASCQKSDKLITPITEDETTAEPARKCASQEVLEEQLKTDPQRARNLDELERKTELFKGRDQSIYRGAGKLYIPVVVNVVLPNASQVTNAQIQSQLDALNKDYNKTNSELASSSVYLASYSYANVANCQIEFYIQDAVNDINRKNSSVATFGSNDAVKKTASGGLNPESATTKMNIWVCDLSSGLLGYAQFPGGSSATDGVVIDYQAFGTSASYPMYAQFNKGRTATHEIGHWFNLRHIWGDARCGNDLVGDTPQHDASNGGCPSTTHASRCTGKPLEQWMNYMDYTDDACMYMFSAGQKTRMDAAIDAARASYVRTTRS
ncbi:MAG: zinc metalloprotease [Flavisolibacter sp.]|jgi:hypothetical protein|nr:zinc metalloprotease [Flavisolibacter sp.]